MWRIVGLRPANVEGGQQAHDALFRTLLEFRQNVRGKACTPLLNIGQFRVAPVGLPDCKTGLLQHGGEVVERQIGGMHVFPAPAFVVDGAQEIRVDHV